MDEDAIFYYNGDPYKIGARKPINFWHIFALLIEEARFHPGYPYAIAFRTQAMTRYGVR